MQESPYKSPLSPADSEYRTTPVDTDRMPPGVPYIIGNEAAERFSYYGMRAILVVFMTHYLMGSGGALDPMTEPEAKEWFHIFGSAVYFFPTLGALLSDGFLGKYRTILYVSLIYCLGHAALAIDDTRVGLTIGLTLIAIGSGGIKPCVSANVGDQFGQRNKHLLEKVYGWFYFSINFGSFFSTLWIPKLLEHYGPSVAFAVPGIFMGLATICFWLGRRNFVHAPPGGLGLLREVFSRDGLTTIGKIAGVYAFVAIFWSLYEQTGSAWVLQAEHMDLRLFVFGWELNASQTHSINPILILAFIPLFSYGVYPAINRVFKLTPLRKISIGFFLTAAAFCISAVIENWIAAGEKPHLIWLLLAYVVMTSAEVMVSITGLEFSYTQAPKKMKSVIMSLWLLSNSAGQFLTAAINHFIQDEHGKSTITGPNYYWMFAGMMAVTAVLFVFAAMAYRPSKLLNDEPAPVDLANEA
jgi:POT family proton-dependent oligopeptide transporter